jgi:Recombination endonuclease VII
VPYKDPEADRAYHGAYNRRRIASWERKLDHLWAKHRMRPADWMGLWKEQRGCCYLCEEPMDPRMAVVDHNHEHCGPKRSCPECWRGLAHPRCNTFIGAYRNDPALIRRIADNLETRLGA